MHQQKNINSFARSVSGAGASPFRLLPWLHLLLVIAFTFAAFHSNQAVAQSRLSKDAALQLLWEYGKATPPIVLAPHIPQDLVSQTSIANQIDALVLLDDPAAAQSSSATPEQQASQQALTRFKADFLAPYSEGGWIASQSELTNLPVLHVKVWSHAELRALADDPRVLSLQALDYSRPQPHLALNIQQQASQLAEQAENLRAVRAALAKQDQSTPSPIPGLGSSTSGKQTPQATSVAQAMLGVSKTGTGKARLFSPSHGQIDCSDACQQTQVNLAVGSSVALHAQPEAGTKVLGWSGVSCREGSNANNTCTFTLHARTSVHLQLTASAAANAQSNGVQREQANDAGMPAGQNKRLAAGAAHTLYIDDSGALWAWGWNSYGVLGDGTIVGKSAPTRIVSSTSWTTVAAGSAHNLAIKSDGTLWAWGANFSGELGADPSNFLAIPAQVGIGTNWTTVAAGASFSLAIKSDGTLWAWGSNVYGQLGDGTTVNRSSPVQVGTATNWTAVAAGDRHSFAVKSDGTLWAWGHNGSGQLGDGTYTSRTSPVQVGAATNWTSVSAGYQGSVAVKSDGTLWEWGQHNHAIFPVQVGTSTNWTAVVAGSNHGLALRSDGTLWAWGYNGEGQLGDGTTVNRGSPVQVGIATNWTAMAGGGSHSMALKGDGSLLLWGDNRLGQLGRGFSSYFSSEAERTVAGVAVRAAVTGFGRVVSSPSGIDCGRGSAQLCVMTASNGASITLTATADSGKVFAGWTGGCSGTSSTCTVAAGNSQAVQAWFTTVNATPFTKVVAGAEHSMAFKSDGTLWGWGGNLSGQLGDGTTSSQNSPAQVTSASNWTTVAAGLRHNVAVKSDGTLWTWGSNSFGELGNGNPPHDRNSPAQVASATNWTAVAAGYSYTLALKSDGTLWAWGLNSFGQLGDGTNTDRSSPVQVGTATNWTSVSARGSHSLALKSDGTLWAWGNNLSGQLGDGTNTHRSSPVQVGTDTHWTSVSAGDSHSLALKSDGTLWAWGSDGHGRLGLGDVSMPRNTPTQVGTDSKWTLVVASNYHSLALKSDGTLWTWGFNTNGELGHGDTADRSSPTQVGSSTNWAALAAGDYFSLALKTDGSLVAWGRNAEGQLGAGGTVWTLVPLVGQPSNAPTFASSVIANGTGNVRSSPAGIDCGGGATACSTSYYSGAVLTLTASPAVGYTFAGWSGACSGTGTCRVTVDAVKNVTATFVVVPPSTYTLSVSKSGTGTGTVTSNPAGIDCGASCSASFNSGVGVTLTAIPTAGHQFTGWSGACSGTGTCTVTLDAAKSVVAGFKNPTKKVDITPILMLLLD